RADKVAAKIAHLALFPVKKSFFHPFVSWINMMIHAKDNPQYPGFDMYPYGVSDEELDRVHEFARSIAQQFRRLVKPIKA
ncbi:MAG: hypothetical protein AAF696_30220, partial [Bacteroidota bacterium]